MYRILLQWRVLSAICFSVVLVLTAYVLAQGIISPPGVEASAESALLKVIATRDVDGDGLPDWEEALYGTSPSTPDTFNLGMTDGEAVAKGLVVPKAIADIPTITSTSTVRVITDPSIPIPEEGTITATFAKSFFTRYLSAVGKTPNGALSQDDIQNIATDVLAELAQSVSLSSNFKSEKDITVSGSGPEAMRSYAVSAEAVFLTNKADATKSEVFYLKDALENEDSTVLEHISSIAKAYRTTAAGLVALSAPTELADEHLALINTMARVAEITEDFTRVNSDPIAAMLALQLYPQAVLDLGNTFIRIHSTYRSSNITLEEGEPGASLVNLIGDVAAEQKASKKP